MIQNRVALGNCLKSGSNRGTGTKWDCAFIAKGVLQRVARVFRRRHTVMIMYCTSRAIAIASDSGLLATTLAYRLAITAPSLEPFCGHAFG